MKIAIPQNAKYILDTLHKAGFEAYVVGGCVRDALLFRTPEDWDITTNALPKQVKQLFKRTIDTGIQHGTVTVMMEKEGYEITTYRIDGKYEDHRRPSDVSFTTNLQEDMLRRDFTINAMAYNDEEGLVDCFGGQEDLKNGIIRCVGDPMERFDEDALRVLRALRFAGQLDFTIEENTRNAMKAQSKYLKDVSAERIRVELTKLLCSDHPELLAEIGESTGINAMVLPEFITMCHTMQENPHHCYQVGMHCMMAVKQMPKIPVLRWAALLHDVGKPEVKTVDEQGIAHFYKHGIVGTDIAKKILKRLKFDNDTIKRAGQLIYWHDYNWGDSVSEKKVRRAMHKIGPEYIADLLLLQRADALAQSTFHQEEKLQILEDVIRCYHSVLEKKQCVTLKDLAINGQDLMQMGMKPGKELGQTLSSLLEKVVENPEWNTKESLMQIVKTQFLK